MDNSALDSLIGKALATSTYGKVIAIILLITAIISGFACYRTSGVNSAGFKVAEEIAEDVIKYETGIEIDLDKILPQDKDTKST